MDCVIITGASKGLGEAIVKQLIGTDSLLFCISRKKNEELTRSLGNSNTKFFYKEFDLVDIKKIESLMNDIFKNINKKTIKKIVLINNTAAVTPITSIENASTEEIKNHFNLNLIAPVLLTSIFIKLTEDMNIEKKIINITSGAASNPYFGWSCYCSSKAGLNMFSRCVVLEQKNKMYPVKIILYDPGAMDTDMQKQIRSTPKKDFPEVERFINNKNENRLGSPDLSASKMIKHILNNDAPVNEVIHIKDLKNIPD
ncbi:MAG: (S)-benzoin forming benzil reductase [Spirochaetes bacterium]|nr:(S)-benzoin forming benzil reductase [Spirochaetota bacterium]